MKKRLSGTYIYKYTYADTDREWKLLTTKKQVFTRRIAPYPQGLGNST